MISFRHSWRRAAWAAILLPLTFVLAACGGGTPPTTQSLTRAPVTPSSRTVQPSTAPAVATDAPAVATDTPAMPSRSPISPTETLAPQPPTTVATHTAAPAVKNNPLPAPVYFSAVGTGQIMRMERDGRTISQITFESQMLLGFDVAVDVGTITYVMGEGANATLVALDGGGRRELLSGRVSTPKISPDGRTVVFRVDDPTPGQAAGAGALSSGVWSIPSSGGRPSIVQADDSLEGQGTPDGTAWSYTPVGYNKSGQRLLLWAYNTAGPGIPGGDLIVLNLSGTAPVRTSTCCEDAAWSVDGSAITISGGGPGPDQRYGLYRIDAATGAERALIAQGDTSYPLVTGARQLLDGEVYAFYQKVSGDVFSWDTPFTPQMVRVAADGTITRLRQDSYQLGGILWREDASGALIVRAGITNGEALTETMLWLDASGSAAVNTRAVGFFPRWADSMRPLYEGDCTLLPKIAWQPPQTRAFSAGVADLQGRLNASGQSAGTPDGFFGDQTRTALRMFQMGHELPLNDSLNCATWQALLGR